MIDVKATCDVAIKPHSPGNDNSPERKDYLVLSFGNGINIPVTTNLAEMIGGAGAGVRKRAEGQGERR